MTLTLLVAATLVSGLLVGLIPTLVDGFQKSLKDRLNLPEQRAEWFVRLFYLAWLPAMPLAGWLLDEFPTREILFGGLVALILGIAWLALIRTASPLLFNALYLGTAYSCVATTTVSLMSRVFFEDYLHHKLPIASLN